MNNSQPDMILDALLRGETITPQTAYERYGITRLAAVIYDLRRDRGIAVETEVVTATNRFGKEVTFARYRLPSVGRQQHGASVGRVAA